jgi:hypothetical protein
MLTRYWLWTSDNAAPPPAVTSLPFGPLRFRAWTSATPEVGDAVTSVSFGPLRFRAWTSDDRPPPPPLNDAINGPPRIRIDLAKYRLIRRDDEEIIDLLASLLASGALH